MMEELLKPDPPVAQAVGYLLLLPAGSRLHCINLASHQWLWRRDLEVAAVSQARLTPSAVCVLGDNGLEALDPRSGRALWRRPGIGPRGALAVDERHVFVVELDEGNQAVSTQLFRLDDGAAVAVKDFSDRFQMKSVWSGRRMVWAETTGDTVALGVYDVLAGKDSWTRKYAAPARLLTSLDAGLLGVVERPGTVHVVRANDGAELAAVSVENELFNKIDKGYLLADADRFYVACVGRSDTEIKANVVPGARTRAVPVDGAMIAIDRVSKKCVWIVEAPRTALILDRFEEMPLILLAGRYQKGPPEQRRVEEVTNLRAFEKRTGRLLFDGDLSNDRFGGFHTLRIDFSAKRVEFVSVDGKITFAAK
jgi:hypothetical protein